MIENLTLSEASLLVALPMQKLKHTQSRHSSSHLDECLRGEYHTCMIDHPDIPQIQADFDRLAAFSQDGWNHNSHYHRFLLRHVPQPCLQALEVGCGSGAFARLLATRAEQVLALDISPQMIRLAQERSQQYLHITFQVADALSWEFPSNHFDCIVSIATLHHVPLEEMLLKMKRALRVNGVLLILDLY